jgi:hypothetical protein
VSAARLQTPEFFDRVPRIIVQDALAQTLGAFRDGIIEYTYLDAVKLCGHSCPTVASAWLMTRAALARLYPREMPRRGEVKVELREPEDTGVAGVMASVAGLVSGAAGDGGFKGLAGRHSRRNLLLFSVPMQGEMRFTRLDSGARVEVSHDPSAVPRPQDLKTKMQTALASQADDHHKEAFGNAWQGWVRAILLDHADDPGLISMQG